MMMTQCPNPTCNGVVLFVGLVIRDGEMTHERYKCVRCGEIHLSPIEDAISDDDDTQELDMSDLWNEAQS
jgi:hypothetical protein